jgi:hypothetical protein
MVPDEVQGCFVVCIVMNGIINLGARWSFITMQPTTSRDHNAAYTVVAAAINSSSGVEVATMVCNPDFQITGHP